MSNCSFKEGDIIYKKQNGDFDFSKKFEIIKIEEDRGNLRDGLEILYIGLLKNMETGETHKYHIETNSLMNNYKICFVCKCFLHPLKI
jgi:hypothetical protein